MVGTFTFRPVRAVGFMRNFPPAPFTPVAVVAPVLLVFGGGSRLA